MQGLATAFWGLGVHDDYIMGMAFRQGNASLILWRSHDYDL